MSRLVLIIDGQEVEGVSGDVVITIGVNNLRDISTRNGNYTNTFNVPRTNKNRQIFGSPEIVQSASAPVYRKLPAQIYVDDVLTVEGFCTFKSSKDVFRLTVFSGSSDFNTSIKSLALEDLYEDLVYLNHEYTYLATRVLRNTTTGVIYPNIDYGLMEKYTGRITHVPFNFFAPSVYVTDLINVAIKKLGYKLAGTPWDNQTYKNLALPCVTVDQGNEVGGGSTSYSYSYAKGTIPNTAKFISFPEQNTDDGLRYTEINIPTFGLIKAYTFAAPVDINTSLKLELSGTLTTEKGVSGSSIQPEFYLRLWIVDKNTGVLVGSLIEILYKSTFVTGSFTLAGVYTDLNDLGLIDYTTDVLVWHIEYFRKDSKVEPRSLSNTSFDNATFTLTQFVQGENENTIQVAKSLPQVKIGDLFKAICNIEGIFTIVDESTKTINGYYYDDIKRNVGQSVDWSHLVDLSEQPEIEYRFNEYGQANVFKYKQDEDDVWMKKSPNFDQGILTVQDTNLAVSVDVIEVPFGTVVNEPTLNGRMALGKIYTGDKYTFDGSGYIINPDAKIDKFDARIIRLMDSTSSLFMSTGAFVLGITSEGNAKVTIDGVPEDLGFFVGTPVYFSNCNGNQTLGGVPINQTFGTVQGVVGSVITLNQAIAGNILATTGIVTGNQNYPVKSRDVVSMNFQGILSNRYGLIKDVLTRTKIVRQLFRLRATDVYRVDFSKPVYVALFSENFYINTITQLKLNDSGSTEVELVRI